MLLTINKEDILGRVLFSNQFTADYSIMREFPLIKTMLISDYLLSSEENCEGF